VPAAAGDRFVPCAGDNKPMDLVEELIALRAGELRLQRPRDGWSLIDEIAFEAEEYLPYWAELWPSGVALARELDGRALRGARVLELGCGLGVPSIVAARAGGRVLASDWSTTALELLSENARANGVELCTLLASWAEPAELVARAPFDLVLAADVLYERRNVALLLRLLPQLGPEVWLADPGREFAEAFLEQAPRSWHLRTSRRGDVRVHRLQRR
jgi:predicted nicotinamide N-methyase